METKETISVDKITNCIDFILLYYARKYLHQENSEDAYSHFRYGECGTFALVLEKLFPNGTFYMVQERSHMIYSIQGMCYDAGGVFGSASRLTEENIATGEDIMNIVPYYGSREYWPEMEALIEELAQVGHIYLEKGYTAVMQWINENTNEKVR